MTDAKLLAELMLQLSIYFESNCDDIAEWLMTDNKRIDNFTPIFLILNNGIGIVHERVMENMV